MEVPKSAVQGEVLFNPVMFIVMKRIGDWIARMNTEYIYRMNAFPKLTALWSLAVFITWTVTSFLCHHFAKTFLRDTGFNTGDRSAPTTNFSDEDMYMALLYTSILTSVQTSLCYILVNVGNSESSHGLLVARVSHVSATWFTNFSMACMFASSTFAIKLMEPITSAVVQFMMLGTPLSPTAILSLPVIVGGAIVFSGNPLTESNVSIGMTAAFASNIILAVRNTSLKMDNTEKASMEITWKPIDFRVASIGTASLVALTLVWLIGGLPDSVMLQGFTALLSGAFHVLYSYVSTGIVLSHLSVVSHAVTNIMKRVLVVLLLYVTGTRSASPFNFLGLVICTLGLLVYAWSKRETSSLLVKSQEDPASDGQKSIVTNLFGAQVKLFLLVSMIFVGISLGAVSYANKFPRSLQEIKASNFSAHAPSLSVESAPSLSVESAPSLSVEPVDSQPDGGEPEFDRTFNQLAHEKPALEKLLPDMEGYLRPQKTAIKEFLQEDLMSNPNRSSFLSKKLRSRNELVKEAQRLHFDIMGKALKQYKYAMVFDIAAFENKGDPCITVGEMYFLKRINLHILYYCSTFRCSNTKLMKAAEKARNYSPSELVILLHGGGNIVGYQSSDHRRFIVFELFKNFKIFVFPQSVYIRDFNDPHLETCASKYCCNKNVTFVMRDHQSYSYAQKYFAGTTNFILAPDMAFQIGPVHRFLSPTFDIMWIRREDSETPGYKTIPETPPGIRMHVSDWLKWLTPRAPSKLETAFYVCTNGFFYLQRGRVVITDRLHGHILSILLNIPHVLIDNKQHKLSAYHHSWTNSLENTVITNDANKAVDLAMDLLRKYNTTLPPRVPFLYIDEDTFIDKLFNKPDSSFV